MLHIDGLRTLIELRITLQQGNSSGKGQDYITNEYITLFFILCYLGLGWLYGRLYEEDRTYSGLPLFSF